MIFIKSLLALFLSSAFLQVMSRECQDMASLIHKLPYNNTNEFKCDISQDCSSVQCKHNTHRDWTVGLAIVSCDDEPIIELEANVASVGISAWKAKLGDNSFLRINGPTPQASGKKLKFEKRYIQSSMKKLSNSIVLSLTLKDCEVLGDDSQIDSLSCKQNKIISAHGLSCEFLENNRTDSLCSIAKLFDCQQTETCLQIGQTSKGECVNIDGLEAGKESTNLLYDAEKSSSTTAPPYKTPSPLTPIIGSFILCLLGVVGVYLIAKFKVLQQARAGFARNNRFRRVPAQDFNYDD